AQIQLKRRDTVIQRLPKIPPCDLANPYAILHIDRLVEAELLAQSLQILLFGARISHQNDRISANANQAEDRDAQKNQGNQRVKDACENVTLHRTSFLLLSE